MLSIAGILDLAGRNKNNLRTKVIDADLGNGYNVLSFAPIPEKTGTRYNYDTRKWIIDRTFYPNSKEYVKGIRFNFQTKEAVYSILREEISNIASWENRSLGTIRGVKVLDSSPFDDYIILDISEDEKGKAKSLKILPYSIRKVGIVTPYIMLILKTRIYGSTSYLTQVIGQQN